MSGNGLDPGSPGAPMGVLRGVLSRSSRKNAPQRLAIACQAEVAFQYVDLVAVARDWPAGCDRRKGGGVVSGAGRMRV